MRSSKNVYSVGLSLPMESIKQLKELERIGGEPGEIKRNGAVKEIERLYKLKFPDAKIPTDTTK